MNVQFSKLEWDGVGEPKVIPSGQATLSAADANVIITDGTDCYVAKQRSVEDNQCETTKDLVERNLQTIIQHAIQSKAKVILLIDEDYMPTGLRQFFRVPASLYCLRIKNAVDALKLLSADDSINSDKQFIASKFQQICQDFQSTDANKLTVMAWGKTGFRLCLTYIA